MSSAYTANELIQSAPMTSVTKKGSPGRLIFGLMFFAVAASLVGNELHPKSATGLVTEPVKIVLGGGAATVILVLLSHAGDTGSDAATGLALLAFVSSVLVFGAPTLVRVTDLVGGTATAAAPTTTKPVASTPKEKS